MRVGVRARRAQGVLLVFHYEPRHDIVPGDRWSLFGPACEPGAVFAESRELLLHGEARRGRLQPYAPFGSSVGEGACRGAQHRNGECRKRLQAHAKPSKSCTATASPASTLPRPCSSTMRQFASDIERSTPEPCWPVVRTFHSAPSRNRMPRWYSVLPGTFLIGTEETAVKSGTA